MFQQQHTSQLHAHLRLPASPATFLNPHLYTPDVEPQAKDMSRQLSTPSSTYSSIANGTHVEDADDADQAPRASGSGSRQYETPSPSRPIADDAATVSSSLSPTDSSLFDAPESYTAESSSLGGSSATSPSLLAVGDGASPATSDLKPQRRRSKQPSHTSKFTSTPPGPLSHARSILEHQAASLLSAARRLREEEMTYTQFQAAQNLIVRTLEAGGKVVWTGVGKSGIIAQKLCATSLSLGLPSAYIDPMSALHGDLGMLNGSSETFKSAPSSSKLPTPVADVVIALSHSGSSPELLALLPHLRLRSVKLIALTARQDSGLGLAAQQSGGNWIDCRTAGYDNLPEQIEDEQTQQSCCPTSSLFSLSSATAGTDEADPRVPAPSSSTTTALAMGDSLVLSCAKMLGLGTQEFAKNHPGGALGKKMMAELEEKAQVMALA